jgi:hypothetical protein
MSRTWSVKKAFYSLYPAAAQARDFLEATSSDVGVNPRSSEASRWKQMAFSQPSPTVSGEIDFRSN